MPLHVILRRRPGRLAALVLLASAGAGLLGCRSEPPAPSILLVVVDTLRADHVGVLRRDGDPWAGATPRLDTWSQGATRFRGARTPAPFTMPAMAGLLTGVYPDRTGVVAHEAGTTLATWKGDSLAEAARRRGLRTAAVIANPWLARESTGFERGFDEFVRLYQPSRIAGMSNAKAVTDEAIRILDEARGKPLLLWAHYFDPHMPYAPPPSILPVSKRSRVMEDFSTSGDGRDLARLYRGESAESAAPYSAEDLDLARRLYRGEVEFVDQELGRLFEHLDRTGLSKNTIVVIASDHGESLGEHGLYFAHDFTVYDELLRVALLVKSPGQAASTRDDDVSLLDVAPTLCRLAALPCSGSFDGRDLFAADPPPRTLFAATTPRRRRGTPWDGLEVEGRAGRATMAVAGARKLVRIPRTSGAAIERYDLTRDAREENPTAEPMPVLEDELDAWTKQMNAARPPAPPLPAKRQQRRDEKTLRSLGYLQ